MLNFERNASAMRRLLRLIIIAGSCAVPFALAQKTTVDWDHNVTDFSSFKTYAWSKPVRPTPNPLMDQRIVAAIDSQLAAKGLQKRESGGDLLVTYFRRSSQRDFGSSHRNGRMENGWWYGKD